MRPDPANRHERLRRLATLAELAEQIEAQSWRGHPEGSVRAASGASSNASGGWSSRTTRSHVPTGWAPVDGWLATTRVAHGPARRDGPRLGRGAVATSGDVEGGLACGALHEWFGLAEPPAGSAPETSAGSTPAVRSRSGRSGDGSWSPPLCILGHLAGQATLGEGERSGFVIWIGHAIWPYPWVLAQRRTSSSAEEATHPSSLLAGISHDRPDPPDTKEILRHTPVVTRRGRRDTAFSFDERTPETHLLRRSLFVDPTSDADRLWTIDLALRCPAVSVVVADGRGLTMAASRRLQLAAEAGGTIGLIARPPEERTMPSSAATRWWVGPAWSPSSRPRWHLQALRCKAVVAFGAATLLTGAMRTRDESGEDEAAAKAPLRMIDEAPRGSFSASPTQHDAGMRQWILEWDHAQGVVTAPADVAGGTALTPASPPADVSVRTVAAG
ncbi:MAG: hypothetical protein HKO59_08580 [Phycisphaerales bacterium]|nr:hypothetical protein [Phycisphaerales bacterium]NNM26024.1 hypothetical protein [Phycisphaerales bacterium]